MVTEAQKDELRRARLLEALNRRLADGWTVERVALAAGIRPQEIHDFKSGRRRLTLRAAEKLAPALAVPVTFLLALDEEPTDTPDGLSRELLDEHDKLALELYRELLKRDREATKLWLALGTIAAEHKDFRAWLKTSGRMAAEAYGLPLEATEGRDEKAAPRRKKAKGA